MEAAPSSAMGPPPKVNAPINGEDASNSTDDGFLSDRKTRAEFARVSPHCKKLVADHVVSSFLRHENGKRLISTDASKQTPGEREALAEACMYADAGILSHDKAGKVDAAFKEFLGLMPMLQAENEKSRIKNNGKAAKNRFNFLVDNFHLLPKGLKIHAEAYLKSEGAENWWHFGGSGSLLRGRDAKNLQRCENLLNMSFANPTETLIFESLHNGSSADGIAQYVPSLNAEIKERMAKSVLSTKPTDETMRASFAYPGRLDPLIQNISCFSPETRKIIKDDFERALTDLTKSRFLKTAQPLKVQGSFRFYEMCKAIDRLPRQEQEEWKFITRHRDLYEPWYGRIK